jgi:serine/threonine protein kinase
MVDFLSKLMVVDPENRLTAMEALSHHWLNASPYTETTTIHRLQMKLLTEEELTEANDKLNSKDMGEHFAKFA